MTVPTWMKTSAAVAAAAGAGSIATDPGSRWYRTLRKPPWQPPPAAFPAVWTPLYALIAVAGTRALNRGDAGERRAFARSYAINLGLNAAWTALFFRAKQPKLALAEIALLNVSNLLLLRQAAKVDRLAGAALAPYVAWTMFATALNAAIVKSN
ncbi:tryptophan-rich sensory protein [Actinoplanes cyaneus]|uniref:Tryptophan-rich sensory protein n=1 Tax=Actinoplanes cyaneus TaxID=52696 RepID=A0A919IGB8_9ACTN|nr:TspO/MBR family protein [Actinoplanes cyaneus]MCW2138123.1 TspO and MBR related proteins [Actinoplanes cyaneus]GID64666.1 tryptophan-rich sensory protein [Actinoplanes cyaneus]